MLKQNQLQQGTIAITKHRLIQAYKSPDQHSENIKLLHITFVLLYMFLNAC